MAWNGLMRSAFPLLGVQPPAALGLFFCSRAGSTKAGYRAASPAPPLRVLEREAAFNVMKNHGYELEHNFGHGETFLAMTLAALNLLAFAWHSALDLLEPPWQA